MTLKSIIITTAIAAVAVLEMSGSASAGKQTWERHKPHVNVGTIGYVKRQKASGHTQIKRRSITPGYVTTGTNTGTQAKEIDGSVEALHPDTEVVLGSHTGTPKISH
jgi:hypothetical protein